MGHIFSKNFLHKPLPVTKSCAIMTPYGQFRHEVPFMAQPIHGAANSWRSQFINMVKQNE